MRLHGAARVLPPPARGSSVRTLRTATAARARAGAPQPLRAHLSLRKPQPQGDGNFVIYDKTQSPLYATNTNHWVSGQTATPSFVGACAWMSG